MRRQVIRKQKHGEKRNVRMKSDKHVSDACNTSKDQLNESYHVVIWNNHIKGERTIF